MAPPMQIQKRPFLIMEILVSLALIAACFFPLTSSPYKAYEKSSQMLYDISLDRISDHLLLQCLSTLQDTHTFKTISNEEANPTLLELDPVSITIPEIGTHTYDVSATVWSQKDSGNFALFECTLNVQAKHQKKLNKKFHYTFSVAKKLS